VTSSTPTIVEAALAALVGPGDPIETAAVPDAPGLYAIHGTGEVWEELGLGAPPDERPLYVGKAERSLARRDLGTHFVDGRTGSSTVRRSLAALLVDPLQLVPCPRNPARPGHFDRFGLEPDSDRRLTAWMHRRLRLATWVSTPGPRLVDVETAVLQRILPPLNGAKADTPWRPALRAARARMAVAAAAGSAAPD
jgi:hypothetical protein